MAKSEGIRGYGSLNKHDLIDTILFHRRVVRPQIDELSQMKRDELRRLAKKEGLNVIGSKKERMTQNLARHRILGRHRTMKDIIEDIANEEYKPQEIKGAFKRNFMRFRSKGIEEEKIVSIEQYLQRVKRHVLKK